MNAANKKVDRESFSKAVLSIQTPLSVTLAAKKCSLERIVDLVPGAMLTFDAHCDEPLTLEAGGKPIAKGDAVKIGDKFGLRIREVLDGQGEFEAER
jgi:flagellar motor switch protein FliN/FliY